MDISWIAPLVSRKEPFSNSGEQWQGSCIGLKPLCSLCSNLPIMQSRVVFQDRIFVFGKQNIYLKNLTLFKKQKNHPYLWEKGFLSISI